MWQMHSMRSPLVFAAVMMDSMRMAGREIHSIKYYYALSYIIAARDIGCMGCMQFGVFITVKKNIVGQSDWQYKNKAARRDYAFIPTVRCVQVHRR